MKVRKAELAFVTAGLFIISSVFAGEKSHWGYSGEGGPDNWATLTSDNYACSGKNQSPINLYRFIQADLQPIQFSYKQNGNEILNNGHTVQVNFEKGSSIKVDDKLFGLLQLHFHMPSENHINGKSFPLEAHFVHADEHGSLAVVAVMFEEGLANKGLERVWSMMPKNAGDKHVLSTAVNGGELLPFYKGYYRFNGSLTTPPCSEGVRWLVLKSPVMVSLQQIEAFRLVLHEPNNRPLQAINARIILK